MSPPYKGFHGNDMGVQVFGGSYTGLGLSLIQRKHKIRAAGIRRQPFERLDYFVM